MKFLNPHILWALPFVAVPIIIYYLMRYRSLDEPWGATYVLERALERLRKRLYLEQILLIALRCLACALLVFAFARPLWTAGSTGLRGKDRHHVVILDASYSMRAHAQGAAGEIKSRWDEATGILKQLVHRWGRGGKWSVLVLGELPGETEEGPRNLRWEVEGEQIASVKEATQIIESIRPGESTASLADALEAVSGRFGTEEVDIYLFSDDQVTTWDGMEGTTWPDLASTPIYRINTAGSDRANVAIASIKTSARVVVPGQPLTAFIGVRNFGKTRVRDRAIRVLTDGKFEKETNVSLLPGQETEVAVELEFDEPGSHWLSARVAGDVLPFDDALAAGVEVVEKIRVRVLRDEGRAGKFESPWGFFQVVRRLKSNQKSPTAIQFQLSDGDVTAEDLGESDVVILDGATDLDGGLAGRLRDWLRTGGGLILLADDQADNEVWNARLGNLGLLPAETGELTVRPFDGDEYRTLARSRFGGPMLKSFRDTTRGDISQGRFYSWRELDPIREGTTVLARFDDDTPFLVAQDPGPGRVLLMAAGMSGRSNNLVVREFFIPFLHRLFSGAASGKIFPRTVRSAGLARLRIHNPDIVRGITFEPGDGEPLAVRPVVRDGLTSVEVPTDGFRVGGRGLCSMLVIRRGDRGRVWYGVQRGRSDSNLAAVPAEIAERAKRVLPLVEAGNWPELEEALRSETGGQEWYGLVMAALTAVLIGEMLMQRRFV